MPRVSVAAERSRLTTTTRCHRPSPRTLCAGGRGGRLIDVGRDGFRPDGDSGDPVGEQVDPEDLCGDEWNDEPEEGAEEHDEDLGRAPGEAEDEEESDVGVDAATLLDGRDDGRQVVVGEHEVGGLPGDLGAAVAHGDADVGSVQGRPVVHPVAGHGDDRAPVLPGLDDVQLLLGAGPGEDPGDGQVGDRPRRRSAAR